MTFLWDYDSGPESERTLPWADFARIWAPDATTVYPDHDVAYARREYYQLTVVDDRVVRIEQQYRP
jgi:hypothetical protein